MSEFDLGEDAHDEDEEHDERESVAWVNCPYCDAEVELLLDTGGAPAQSYVEDCEVCCRPWHLTVRWDAEGAAWVEVATEEEA